MRCPSTWVAERAIRRQRLVLHLLPMRERWPVISHRSSSNSTIQATASIAFREIRWSGEPHLDTKLDVAGSVPHITCADHVDSKTKCNAMHSSDYRTQATRRSCNSLLELAYNCTSYQSSTSGIRACDQRCQEVNCGKDRLSVSIRRDTVAV